MMLQIFKADLLKLKRKGIWFLVFLGPFGVISLQGVNYGLRYDWLVRPESDVWHDLLENINMLLPITLLLGVAIIASMTANIEHQQSSWKQLLALPIRKISVFASKFLLNFLLLFVSSILVAIGTVILGLCLKFGFEMPVVVILENSFYPLFAVLPLLALQTWLSVTLKNQALPLTIGILGAIGSPYGLIAPDWFIWKWPLMLSDVHEPIWFAGMGLILGFLLFLVAAFDFTKRDVK